jgi:hypothetical protein
MSPCHMPVCVSLWYPPACSVAVSLCRCVAVSLCRCVAVSLCRCVAVSLCRCVAVSLCPFVAASPCIEHLPTHQPIPGGNRPGEHTSGPQAQAPIQVDPTRGSAPPLHMQPSAKLMSRCVFPHTYSSVGVPNSLCACDEALRHGCRLIDQEAGAAPGCSPSGECPCSLHIFRRDAILSARCLGCKHRDLQSSPGRAQGYPKVTQ